ncbi:YggS family pyridoxal phosphate-dependent enzyme [Paenibacillus albiflavus]|uniref:Pyridoxal phosphate homeostasis protein n=1 Tax=Paenibacillus albiflavus TaxID=2545760 RepID=A0A4R4E1H5_9BACL|nr:YggS family pyridoxal phosphate-dependent enzyme [Paenibacillus albiflavus]TCZ72302.1 YggS family pyridoxal phosphate-dependent enzyme [Paenibacillus albiflavus]
MDLQNRINQVKERMNAACIRSGRKMDDVQLIAVTKYVGVEETRAVMDHGLLHIGENRWQNAKEKWEQLHNRGTWHFIGHLQTNKVKDVIGKFTYIHSLDRVALADEIEKKAAALDITQQCFIQLNVAGEESKYGLDPEQLFELARHVSQLPHLQIVGLMTMAPLETDAEATRPVFRELRRLRDELNDSGILNYEVLHLSMGMSGDYEVAIEEGATWIRVGSAIL